MNRTKKKARLVGAMLLLALTMRTAPAQAASSHQLIEGSGSSWATNALNVWIAGVTSNGLKVVFTSTGSATGRKDFGNATNDFAVSDIGYQGKDPQTGDTDLPCKLGTSNNCRDYAYLPIVAGGTAFTYHLEVGGKLVRNLRLSGKTLALIFTGGITNWNDKAITADNNGRVLPSTPIIPVSHAEGSGSSAQFTTYLDSEYPSIWRAYNNGRAGETEYFKPSKNGIQQSGSDGVINFITSSAANGAIGYDEYSYALAKNYPVAKIENKAGYFTLPDQYNVAVSLQKAQINTDKTSPDYLLQKLTNVYRYTDKRTYPLSSYSYMIIPTSKTDERLNTAKRQTLADFIYYSVCQGQAQIGPVGYSPLPVNLVQASFDQTAKLKAADPGVDLTKRDVSTCNNPTFVAGNPKGNHLAQIAPNPQPCDAASAGPCGSGSTGGTIGGASAGGTSGSGSAAAGTGGAGKAGGGPAGTTGTAATAGTGGGAAAGAGSSGGAPVINPDTGQVQAGGTSAASDDLGVATDLAAYRPQDETGALASLAAVELLAVLIAPPLLYFMVLRRRRRTSS